MEDEGKGNYFSSPLSQIHLQLNIKLGACYAKTDLETAQTPLLLNQMAISTLFGNDFEDLSMTINPQTFSFFFELYSHRFLTKHN